MANCLGPHLSKSAAHISESFVKYAEFAKRGLVTTMSEQSQYTTISVAKTRIAKKILPKFNLFLWKIHHIY